MKANLVFIPFLMPKICFHDLPLVMFLIDVFSSAIKV